MNGDLETTKEGNVGASSEGVGESSTTFISPVLRISKSRLVEFVGDLFASSRRATEGDNSEVSETKRFVISGFIENTSDGEVDGSTSVGNKEINLNNSFGPSLNTTNEVVSITVVPVRSVESVHLTISNNLNVIVTIGRVNQPEIEREDNTIVTSQIVVGLGSDGTLTHRVVTTEKLVTRTARSEGVGNINESPGRRISLEVVLIEFISNDGDVTTTVSGKNLEVLDTPRFISSILIEVGNQLNLEVLSVVRELDTDGL